MRFLRGQKIDTMRLPRDISSVYDGYSLPKCRRPPPAIFARYAAHFGSLCRPPFWLIMPPFSPDMPPLGSTWNVGFIWNACPFLLVMPPISARHARRLLTIFDRNAAHFGSICSTPVRCFIWNSSAPRGTASYGTARLHVKRLHMKHRLRETSVRETPLASRETSACETLCETSAS